MTSVQLDPLKAGDKITTVLHVIDAETGELSTYVVRTTIVTAFMAGGFQWQHGTGRVANGVTMGVDGQFNRLWADEHSTWIRDWPAWDSAEVKALLVAEAMGPGVMPEHEMACPDSGDYDYSTGYTFNLGRDR